MRLFDTHCHFESSDPSEIRAILARAAAVGVTKLMAVGGSAALNASATAAWRLSGAADCPVILRALGHDRDQVNAADVQAPLETAQVSARGEIGLDYHYSPGTRATQLDLFARELEVARAHDLPVVIHTREADDDTLALLREIPSRGIIHCYTGTPEAARRYLDLGFFISISGIVTFRAADNVRATALAVPDDRILIETDAPYLAPVPMRGNPNEPAFLIHTCEFLAKLRGMDAETFAELTFNNAERILK